MATNANGLPQATHAAPPMKHLAKRLGLRTIASVYLAHRPVALEDAENAKTYVKITHAPMVAHRRPRCVINGNMENPVDLQRHRKKLHNQEENDDNSQRCQETH